MIDTPGLRALQDKAHLIAILSGLNRFRDGQQVRKPLLVKIAPDLSAEQIEVIRGPASLLYSSGAIGGVVNVLDHRIPKESLDGVIGRGETRFGGADNERSAAAVVDIGNGLFALHADAYKRKTNDLSIPDSASAKLKNIDGGTHAANGKLVNSAAESDRKSVV